MLEKVIERNLNFVPSVMSLISELYNNMDAEALTNLMMVLNTLVEVEKFNYYSGRSIIEIIKTSPDYDCFECTVTTTQTSDSQQLRIAAKTLLSNL